MRKRKVHVAILIEEAYQDLEVWYPLLRLKEESFKVMTVGTTQKFYKGKYGYPIEIDTTIDKVSARDFDCVVIPGGWAPDKLRRFPRVNSFVRDIFEKGGVVASICHGGSVLVSAGILKGRTVTSFDAIKDDIVNAGAKFVDKEVAVDNNLITSRKPDDLPAFLRKIIKRLKEIQY
ncbi:MAG: type 1 glutamine amidotransferase [Candidatus Omnitrophica bacterium]|nr:type 1 glutamine amidotransferase [Candidatus Omnitrophota bacterium]